MQRRREENDNVYWSSGSFLALFLDGRSIGQLVVSYRHHLISRFQIRCEYFDFVGSLKTDLKRMFYGLLVCHREKVKILIFRKNRALRNDQSVFFSSLDTSVHVSADQYGLVRAYADTDLDQS